jgi:transcriptional regulator with XRE-family HTH domain
MENQEQYAELRGKIRAKYRTQEEFARAIGMHASTLSAKLNGNTQWTSDEIVTACKVLDIPLADAAQYFFT